MSVWIRSIRRMSTWRPWLTPSVMPATKNRRIAMCDVQVIISQNTARIFEKENKYIMYASFSISEYFFINGAYKIIFSKLRSEFKSHSFEVFPSTQTNFSILSFLWSEQLWNSSVDKFLKNVFGCDWMSVWIECLCLRHAEICVLWDQPLILERTKTLRVPSLESRKGVLPLWLTCWREIIEPTETHEESIIMIQKLSIRSQDGRYLWN